MKGHLSTVRPATDPAARTFTFLTFAGQVHQHEARSGNKPLYLTPNSHRSYGSNADTSRSGYKFVDCHFGRNNDADPASGSGLLAGAFTLGVWRNTQKEDVINPAALNPLL